MTKFRYPVAAVGFLVLLLVPTCPLHGSDWIFVPGTMSGGHIGQVTAVLDKGDTVISAGEDGFLEIWSGVSGNATVERFQITAHRIIAMAGRPGSNELSLVKTDGLGLFTISAWNYRQRRNLFQVEFRSPIAHISYSMGGSFIMAGVAGAAGLVFIDAANGNTLPSPTGLGGTVALAVTGRTERNIMVYLSSGVISYRNLDSGAETHRFNAPANLVSPVLFSNNRFIAGLSPQGLTVVNAVSGHVVARDVSIPVASLLSATDDTLYALVNRAGSAELRRLSIDQSGNLIALASFTIPLHGGGPFTAMDASSDRVALGTSGGGLVLAGGEGEPRALTAVARTRITDAAVSGETIGFLAENRTWGFIPLDYNALTNGGAIRIMQGGGNYNRITPFISGDDSGERFIFWQNQHTRTFPSIRSTAPSDQTWTGGGIAPRFPLRSVTSFAGRAMFMDTVGNISVVSPFDEGGSPFRFSSVGLLDAAFIDNDRLILGRSAISGGTPLLSLNVITGETVPMPLPAQAAVILQRGTAGDVYAVAISQQAGGSVTSILRIDPENPANSERVLSFHGEHTQFSFAETPAGIAATVNGEIATLHSAVATELDRTPGFPYRLIEGERHIVSLDRDGNIAWHDNQSGRLRAIFRLHPDGWTLQTQRGTIGGVHESAQ